jgi:N-methylhydantoinase B
MVAPDGAERELASKGSFMVPTGGAICFRAPGAGGFGPPAERDPERLQEDVLNGYVSPEAARRDYGMADARSLVCPHCARATTAPHPGS